MKEKIEEKKGIIIAICILVIVLFFVILIINSKNNKEEEDEEELNTSNNNIVSLYEEDLNEYSEIGESSNSIKNEVIDETSEEELITEMTEVNSLTLYFLLKECLESYYTFGEEGSTEILEKLIDKEAINMLEQEDIEKMISSSSPAFSIDKIYGQEINSDINVFLVYHRVEVDSSTCESTAVLIKLDEKNSTFSIYPYEYIIANNYENMGDGEQISIENYENIEENEYNKYDVSEISTSGEECTLELFKKYKFDLFYDIEHLYNELDEEYRTLKFPTIEELEEYIEENKVNLYLDTVVKYRVRIYTDYVELSCITKNNKYLTFQATNDLTDFTLYLDNYTIVLSDTYEDSLETWQAPYCLERIFSAINEKDYDFVYKHLNPVQKSNYYKTEEEFIEYMEKNFYESNDFEINDDYLIVSDEIYQYTVQVTNSENTSQSKTLTMTVTVKDGTDFVVAIN